MKCIENAWVIKDARYGLNWALKNVIDAVKTSPYQCKNPRHQRIGKGLKCASGKGDGGCCCFIRSLEKVRLGQEH